MIMQLGYSQGKFIKVRVCGIECDFSDMRIDRKTVPVGRYHCEVADNNESQSDLARVGIVMHEAVLPTHYFG